MKLKIYRIYCEPSDCEHCSAIAFMKEQAEKYCAEQNKRESELPSYMKAAHDNEWFYTEEEEIDTDKVFECE